MSYQVQGTIEVYDPANPDANGKAARYAPRSTAAGGKLAG